jgi:hypothetical protein
MGKIDIPLVGRHIGALAHVTHVAEIALIDNLGVIGLVDTIYFHGLRLIDQIEKCRKSVAQTHAAATTVTDIVDSLQLLVEIVPIVKRR